MKLTSREKNLIVVAAALLLVFLIFRFMIQPLGANLKTLQAELSTKQELSNQNNLLIANSGNLKNSLAEIDKNINAASKKYFTALNQEEIIWAINQSAENIDFNMESMTFEIKEVDETNPFRALKARVPFSGSYDGVLSFLSNIREYEKKIVVEDLDIKNQEIGVLAGVITLTFYSISDQMVENIEFKAESENNKNPFEPFNASAMEEISEDMPLDFDINKIAINVVDSFVLYDEFEDENYKIVTNDRDAKFSIASKENENTGSNCLQIDYDFLADSFIRTFELGFENKRAYITKPAKSILLDIYTYNELNAAIVLKTIGADNRQYNLFLAGSVDAVGWTTLSTEAPQSYRAYPLKIQSVEIALNESAFGGGQIKLDNLKGVFTPNKIQKNDTEQVSGEYMNYIVKKGDTLYSISMSQYGTKNMIDTIMKLNGMSNNNVVIGKKILLPVLTAESRKITETEDDIQITSESNKIAPSNSTTVIEGTKTQERIDTINEIINSESR